MQFLKVSVEPSLALQQVSRSVPKAKLTSNQAMAMDAFYEATKGNVVKYHHSQEATRHDTPL
jgi:hypothetical protein